MLDLMKVRFAVAPDVSAQDGHGLIAFADALEASGFDGVWLSDVTLAPVIDPLLGLAMIAGRTTRLRLGANVVPLGRNPFLLAKELAQLDRLAAGRLLLSFVPGIGHPGEREVLGVAGAARGAVLEQALGLIRAWWTGAEVEGITAPTRPLQDPLEVWLGGRGPKALQRVGRIADGWLGAAVTPEEAGPACERITRAAAEAQRVFDPEHFGLSIPYARTAPDPTVLDGLRARRPDIDPLAMLPVGVGALRDLIQRYVEAGLSKFVLRPATPVSSWDEEAAWLGGAILHLQT
jgi:probable F420-dependent oxidoreductase